MCIMVWSLTLAWPKYAYLPYLQRYMDCYNWLSHALLHIFAISIDSYSPINKFCSFIIFSQLINAVILLLNCLVIMLYLYIYFLSLRCFFLLRHYLELYVTDTALKVSWSLLFYYFCISCCWKLFPQAVSTIDLNFQRNHEYLSYPLFSVYYATKALHSRLTTAQVPYVA